MKVSVYVVSICQRVHASGRKPVGRCSGSAVGVAVVMQSVLQWYCSGIAVVLQWYCSGIAVGS